jgi:hypothetical protein
VQQTAEARAGGCSEVDWDGWTDVETRHFVICTPRDKLALWRILHCLIPQSNFVQTKWPVAGFPPRRPGFEPRSGHVAFVTDKVALGQVFSEYFGFPCQFSFHRLLHTHHLSSGAGTIGQLVADVPSGLSLTPLQTCIHE